MSLSIKRPERTVDLCTDASVQADWEQAERELAAVRQRPAVSIAGNGASALAERVRGLEQRMRESMVHFRLRALPRSEWAAILSRHPAGDDEMDKRFGADRAAFFEDVIPASIVAVTDTEGEPVEFDPATEWTPLADEMTDRQYSEFVDAALVLNRGEVNVPFSRAASRIRPDSSES